MSWLRFGKGLLAVSVLCLGGVTASADTDAGPSPDACCAPCAPQMMTVTVCEMVPEQYQSTVTRYKWEPVQENFTAYKSEWVSKPMTRNFTVMVPNQENYT